MRLSRICVVTSKAGAYYALVSRLRRAELPFSSLVRESGSADCDLILTTADEAKVLGGRVMALEELDESPEVFKGQVLSKIKEGEPILVGLDPGKRTGMAVFYGQTSLALSTFDSVDALCARVRAFAESITDSRVIVRIGNGDRVMANRLAEAIGMLVPRADVEVVDESGTSIRTSKMKGVQGDQSAAAKIAFRRGTPVAPRGPRSPLPGSPGPGD